MSEAERIRVLRDAMNSLRGQMFGFVEMLGLDARQEAAGKKLIRRVSYDAQERIESALSD